MFETVPIKDGPLIFNNYYANLKAEVHYSSNSILLFFFLLFPFCIEVCFYIVLIIGKYLASHEQY